ncbi:8466_t:CDS:2 [Dentiscutata erythropus]|uniref:8466_t:CDS:1 n=1 Tax=Dentiscutata erythropus TaxID=1348616 RepID=A0A9N9ET62_9GLOM|nr:8466_t:CDS:2 [Dentiscutata erythropus]
MAGYDQVRPGFDAVRLGYDKESLFIAIIGCDNDFSDSDLRKVVSRNLVIM